ncbi:hypothetical protein PM082_016512, partial [Marasmius tenuissimus]
ARIFKHDADKQKFHWHRMGPELHMNGLIPSLVLLSWRLWRDGGSPIGVEACTRMKKGQTSNTRTEAFISLGHSQMNTLAPIRCRHAFMTRLNEQSSPDRRRVHYSCPINCTSKFDQCINTECYRSETERRRGIRII